MNLTGPKNYLESAEVGREASWAKSREVFQVLREQWVATWVGVNSWGYETVSRRGRWTPGHGNQTFLDRRDILLWHSIQINVSVSSHLKWGQVNRLLPLSPLLVVRNRESTGIEASASFRWKQTPLATDTMELGYWGRELLYWLSEPSLWRICKPKRVGKWQSLSPVFFWCMLEARI